MFFQEKDIGFHLLKLIVIIDVKSTFLKCFISIDFMLGHKILYKKKKKKKTSYNMVLLSGKTFLNISP
jgi:hypothetical protein